MQKTCIVICGPTAVGKTGLSIELAKRLGTEIISADSRQCYRELNIGVAKPSSAQLEEIPHFFINSHSIVDDVNAAAYERYADDAVSDIFTRHNEVVMVGGTGLYLRAFCDGLDEMPEIDLSLRVELRQQYEQQGMQWLANKLRDADPEYFINDEMSNSQRMLRGLEIMLTTGRSIRSFQLAGKKTQLFKIIKIGLELPREKLYHQINERVDRMIEAGFEEEAKELLPYRNYNALNTVGYKELFSVFDRKFDRKEAIRLIKQNTRHYAKRQLTWFKRDATVKWFSADFQQEVINYCVEIIL